MYRNLITLSFGRKIDESHLDDFSDLIDYAFDSLSWLDERGDYVMQELSQAGTDSKVNQADERAFAVFMYTPLCGTCKVTERMLDIIMTMQPSLPLVKCNINFLPQISQDMANRECPVYRYCGARRRETIYVSDAIRG